jgi:hypothetical protein
MDAISTALSVIGMKQVAVALDVETSLTRKAFDEMQSQAAALLATIPAPQEFSGRGAFFDAYA